jgi:hypothetical protein
MDLTDFHAKYFAHELTKRSPSDSVEMLAGVLADAQVDLNPHQIEAALFAFRNPFSRGAILADEVGLGKTIEAGLLLAQRWAERKLTLLVQTFQLDAIAVAALFDGQTEGAPEFSTEAVNGKPLLRRISSAAAAALSSFSCRPRTIILNHMPLDRNQWVMG